MVYHIAIYLSLKDNYPKLAEQMFVWIGWFHTERDQFGGCECTIRPWSTAFLLINVPCIICSVFQ